MRNQLSKANRNQRVSQWLACGVIYKLIESQVTNSLVLEVDAVRAPIKATSGSFRAIKPTQHTRETLRQSTEYLDVDTNSRKAFRLLAELLSWCSLPSVTAAEH